MKFLKSSLSLLAVLSFGAPAFAAENSCSGAFGITLVRAFPVSRQFQHTTHYDRELEPTSSVKDQCNLGTCHLYSWATMLELGTFKRNGKSISISTRYLAAQRILQMALVKLASSSPKDEIGLGAWFNHSRALIKKVGIIPEGVWEPKTDFEVGVAADQFLTLIQNIIDRAKWVRDSQEGRMSPMEKNQPRSASFVQAEKAITELMDRFVGPFPESFLYEGTRFTPKSFAKHYFPELEEPMTELLVAPTLDAPTELTSNIGGVSQVIVNLDAIEDAAKHVIDRGESVYLAYYHEGAFVDKATGIMSLSAFDLPENLMPVSRLQRKRRPLAGGHAVQVIGYELDPETGRVRKWKMKNSWGKKAGDKGYYHMYSDYFRTYASAVTFYSRAAAPLPSIEISREHQLSLPF